MSKQEDFLTAFRNLEQDLEEISRIKDNFVSYSRALNKIYADRLNPLICADDNYEFLKAASDLRNIMVHNNDIAEPTEGFLDRFLLIAKEIRYPTKCLDLATPASQIYYCHPSHKILDVVMTMNGKGLSHIPVEVSGEIVGVFSRTSFFDFFLSKKGLVINNETTISDFLEAINFDSHQSESYQFISESVSAYDVLDKLDQKKGGKPRLVCLFITKHGSKNEPLLGIMTGRDLLKLSSVNH